MATELSFLPPNQSHQNHTHQPPYPSIFTRSGGTWMWTPHPAHDDDSWEVRAFAEDTASLLGTTWPPRSYTCNFCRREFRSAQALGGHMNVHRRDRARLHQAPPPPASSASSALFFRSQEFAGNGGLCLLYQLPNPSNPNGVFTPATINPWNNNSIDSSPSTLLSVSPYPAASTSIGASPSNYPVIPPGFGPSKLYYRKPESPSFPDEDNRRKEGGGQELDLELRLGQGPATTPLP